MWTKIIIQHDYVINSFGIYKIHVFFKESIDHGFIWCTDITGIIMGKKYFTIQSKGQ